MRRDVKWLLLAALVGMSCSKRNTAWVEHACDYSVSPTRDRVAYVNGGRLHVKQERKTTSVSLSNCTDAQRVEGVTALPRTNEVLVWGYTTDGGNWMESGQQSNAFACVVNTETGMVRKVAPQLLRRRLVHFRPVVGAKSGWLYDKVVSRFIRIIDLDHERSVEISVDTLGRTMNATVTELGTKTRIVAARSVSLVVVELNRKAWPPTVETQKNIAIGGRVDRIRISPDGRWAAYSGYPYVPKTGFHQVHDVGLIDLDSGKIVFERLKKAGDVRVEDVLVVAGRPAVLVTKGRGEQRQVRWLDADGPGRSTAAAGKGRAAMRLDWGRVLVESQGCTLRLVDLAHVSDVQQQK